MNKEKLKEHLKGYNFDETNVELALRANCRCEYCDKDLFESIDNYKLWQVDHIIPKYYKDASINHEDFDNKALTCTQCNKDFKNKWNPALEIGGNKSRVDYLIVIKEYIKNEREIKQKKLDEIKNLFKLYIPEK